MSNERIAILLAAGKSKRFGREKPLLKIRGQSLIERHIKALESFKIDIIYILVNENNYEKIRRSLKDNFFRKIKFFIQKGTTMEAAIFSILDNSKELNYLLLINVNDIISDEDYDSILNYTAYYDLLIPTYTLKKEFSGGYLEHNNGFVNRIIEKPIPSCPPGKLVNIFIHKVINKKTIDKLKIILSLGMSYEQSVNNLISEGVIVKYLIISEWVSIKYADDYTVAKEIFEK